MWLKALHLIFMVTWFAGLFYLPRLFVYHALSEDQISRDRFKIMERKLFYGIDYAWASFGQDLWLHLKLMLIVLLVIYHIMCGKYLNDFKHERNNHSHIFYRWFNEVPVLILVLIVILASVKPF